jgi:hypothetical protein
MQCKQYIVIQQLVQYHNNVLCNGRDVKPSVHTVQVPVDDSAATAAPASSAYTWLR